MYSQLPIVDLPAKSWRNSLPVRSKRSSSNIRQLPGLSSYFLSYS
jgi:hypothetical protein